MDLQVLGVWDNWQTNNGRIDLSESQLDVWGSTVAAGWRMAGKQVPVVLFHDWGFDGFPWGEISPEDRRLWIRVRGAEIYAAGGFFAFPVHAGNDSRRDGTLPEIARQSRFYQRTRTSTWARSFSASSPWKPASRAQPGFVETHVSAVAHPPRDQPPGRTGQAQSRRSSVAIKLPTGSMPKAVSIVSPDWEGEKPGEAHRGGGKLTVVVPELEAYSVAILPYDQPPAVTLSGRRIVPSWEWVRPARNEFAVPERELIPEQWRVPGLLQGMLHRHLRNPPTFVVNMARGGSLAVHVRGVAMLGARLQWQVDGRVVQVVDLPDRDGKNDAMAKEYDQTFEFAIPPGRHRVTLDNIGGDWACIGWYAFKGETLDP